MKTVNFRVANAQPFVGREGIVVLGKNGFESTLGQIKPLVTSATVSSANIDFTVSNLHLLYDDNFNCHILEARSNAQLLSLSSRVPDNLVTFSINSKIASNTAGKISGTVGHESTLESITANIIAYDINANTISIGFSNNSVATSIKNKLLSTPFYINLNQLIDKRFSSSNTYYVSGDLRLVSTTHNVTNVTGTANLALGTTVPLKGLISTYINGAYQETDSEQYSYIPGTSYITHNLSNTDLTIKTVVEDYAVPHLEDKDLVYIYDNQQTVEVNATSYTTTSSIYNAALTASDFFKVKLTNNLTSNVSSAILVNITEDLIADISETNTTSNVVSVTYNDTVYPYNFNLASQGIYNMAPFDYSLFRDVEIVDNKISVPTVSGVYIFKVASVNELGRLSSPVTKSVSLEDLPLGQVENFSLTEILFRDRTKGVMSRISGVFDHIEGRNVQEYDIAYRINLVAGTEPHPSGMTNFNSFKVDKSGVGTDGKVRFTIDNIDIGKVSNLYEIEVMVTPINGINRGLYNTKKLELRGKSDRPLPLTNFNVYQTDNTVVFEVDYPVDSQDNLNELDILHTEIRVRSPIVAISTVEQRDFAFTNGDLLILIPHPLTRAEISADRVGEGSFTFTAKTVDTSGNKSGSASARNLSVDLPSTILPIAAWNEADPSANVIAGVFNNNYGANYFVGVTESDNGGLVYDIDPVTSVILGYDVPSSNAEDANSSASGFSWSANANGVLGASDLVISGPYASYISPIRDLGEVVRGSIAITSTVDTQLTKTWLEISENLIVGVAEQPPSPNVLFDADFEIGTVVGYNNSNFSFSFSNVHATIIDNSPHTRVFAIVNPGQEVPGEMSAREDVSNVFSYALISGAINAHAVEISNVYYANGTAVVGGNTSGSIAVANLTAAGSSYRLVDLYQFIDEEAERDYTPELDITKNVYVRFASANVFTAAPEGSSKPHGNVSEDLFDSTSLDGNWTQQYSGIRNFRYFQVRLDINIADYGETANAYLDQLYYQVSSPRKIFNSTVTSTGNILGNIAVDFSSTGFYNSPSVFCQVLSEGPYLAKTNSLTNDGCNVRLIDTTTGNVATVEGIEILVSATGA
jgi:hypothetical protein